MNQITEETYVASTAMPVTVQQAFDYHDRPGALERLIPPWENVVIESSDNSLQVGSRVVMKTSLFGIPLRWVAEHTQYEPPRLFADTQVSGPFKSFNHQHHFVGDDSDEHCVIRDQIRFKVPLGGLGNFFGEGIARRRLESMFAYRHRVTREDLELLNAHPTAPIKVAISGSTGLVGRQLCALLRLLGHDVVRLVRAEAKADDEVAIWSDSSASDRLEDMDAVIHLAGKPIADKRWTETIKDEIRDSRVIKTRELCETLASLTSKPKTMICASATGFYGDRGDEVLNETSEPGEGFLPSVCVQWEESCQPAIDAGIRVVNARLGLVLTPQGGALSKMLLPAKLAGGSLGNGKQWCGWIALDDVLGGIYHVLFDESVVGPVNFVAPEPITNRDFASTLGQVVGRPALFPAPAFGLRLALGEMADALLLASVRAVPEKMLAANYAYRFTDLHETLRYYLGVDRLETAE